MNVLIVKTSSMGDVLHTLPAVTDATNAIDKIEFDWAVEPGFAEIPRWHPSVREIIPLPIRRWRKAFWKSLQEKEIQSTIATLRKKNYDYILDAQGLLKSAIFARFAKGKCVGYDFLSVREKLAALFYQQKYTVLKNQHAVERVRQLFAQALGYVCPSTLPDYGIDQSHFIPTPYGSNYLLFLHGTTWETKHWPQIYWEELMQFAATAGYQVLLPWGNQAEQRHAEKIKKNHATAMVLPKLSLSEMANVIANAKGIVAVDTGLGHVAAAIGVPTVSLYGPTDPVLTGAYGPFQSHLISSLPCSPCFSKKCLMESNLEVKPPCFGSLTPQRVWDTLLRRMNEDYRAPDMG